MSTIPKIRIITPDLLKGIAILFMIQVHLMELFAQPAIFHSWLGKLSLFLGGSPAAPIFMIIMGYFAAQSSMSIMAMIKRGIQLIVWGMLLNVGLNLNIIYHVLFLGWDFNIWQYIFGVDILQLAGLSLIIIAVLPKILKDKWFLLALLIIAVFALSYFNFGEYIHGNWRYLTAYFIGGTEWSYFPLLPWLAYPLSGFVFYHLETFFLTWSWHIYFKVLIIMGFIILLGFSWNYSSTISHQLKLYYNHHFDFYLWTITFSLFWAGLIHNYSKEISHTKFGKYLIFLGKNITSIYVFQWLIIGNLATLWYQQKNVYELVIYLITITILTSFLTWIWNKTKQLI
jgi:uncharacterized membrane protein